jgi:hypothetical protein
MAVAARFSSDFNTPPVITVELLNKGKGRVNDTQVRKGYRVAA